MKNQIFISLLPRDILAAVKKHLLLVIAATVLAAAGTYAVTAYIAPKQYTASMSFYVEANITFGGKTDYLQSSKYARDMIPTYIKMLETNHCRELLSEALDGDYTPEQLSSMIMYVNDTTTDVFDAYVTADSAREAKRVAEKLAEIAPSVISQLNADAKLKVAKSPLKPGAPSTPSARKLAVFAAIAGFILAVFAAMIIETLDRRIRYQESMTEILGLPVLAAVPNFDPYLAKK